MIGLVDRALALNPSFAQGWHTNAFSGYLPVNPISRSSISRPRAPEPARARGTSLSLMGIAYFFKRPV